MYQNVATKVLTGEVRLSYEHLTKPYANANNPGQDPRFSVTLLIPKADVATKADIDQSIMTRSSRGPLRKLGSVAAYIVRRAPSQDLIIMHETKGDGGDLPPTA